jgi:hypothetical protein
MRASVLRAVWVVTAALAAASCGGGSADGDSADAATLDAPTDGIGADASSADAAVDAPPLREASAEAAAPLVTTEVISTSHRYIAGASGMFGGWGPHLGHLVRRTNGQLWFADDSCDDSGPQACTVTNDWRIDYFTLESGTWSRVASQTLPAGIQQNTGSILAGDTLCTYGVDTATSEIVECTLSPATLVSTCADLPLPFPAGTNYVGAAISPAGYKLAWATTVANGGGGSFGWIVDYGGGWNGPRSGPIGGYNDASYIDMAFFGGTRSSQFTMLAELVTGLAPNWSFTAGTGDSDSAGTTPVAFTVLPPAGTDASYSTDDVAIDPTTNDTHLFASTASGAAAYYFRPDGGAFAAPSFVMPMTYRVRLVFLADGRLVLLYGPDAGGLAMRVSPKPAAGVPVDWASLPAIPVALPPAFGMIEAIYTESSIYEQTPPASVNLAVVGSGNEREVLHVGIAM